MQNTHNTKHKTKLSKEKSVLAGRLQVLLIPARRFKTVDGNLRIQLHIDKRLECGNVF